jgi:hypothetical protein
MWDPMKSQEPSWYAGMGFNEETAYLGPMYRALEGMGSGAAKGEAVLGGLTNLAGRIYSSVGTPRVVGQEIAPIGTAIQQEARERVQQMTPDAATSGAALRVLHGVSEGGYLMATGALLGGTTGAAAVVGGTEGGSRYQELREQGVDQGTAAASGALAGVTSAAGAVMPAAYGAGLLTNIATGAAANTAFGVADRFLDHKILERGGYPEMADQQKALDGTQMLVDAALGATFGVIHHAGHVDPEKQDAALTANLALRDRQSAPGVATDPAAANAHEAALEKAQTDLMQGKPVDVSDSGVGKEGFLSRPARELTPENDIILKSFKESGLLDEEANLRDLEDQFSKRIGQPVPERESVKPTAEPGSDEYSVREEALTDDYRNAFQGLRSDIPADEELAAVGGGESEQPRPEDAGGSGEESGEPLSVYRGAERKLTPEDFEQSSLGHATGHPSSGLGVFFSHSKDEAAHYGEVTEHRLDIRNPKVVKAEDLPGFDSTDEAYAYREKLREQGHDGMVIDASHLGGPVNYVAFDPHQAIPDRDPKLSAGGDPIKQALAEKPDLQIADENGKPVNADMALEGAKPETDWFTATKAAADCFSRRGG